MRLTNKRLYLDYNATSPLADSVKNWLSGGDLLWGNPQALHQTGKRSAALIRVARDYLLSLFGLQETHDLFFHSGATEGCNTILQSAVLNLDNTHPALFIYSPTDHACVRKMRGPLKNAGLAISTLKLNQQGDFDKIFLIDTLNRFGGNVVINYSWVQNDTGIVWDLKFAEELKKKTGCLVHVDATQAPFKIRNWMKLSDVIDAYTFSGHKFSALAGTGFTLVRKNFKVSPLVRGGGQEGGLRSGTQNMVGIHSMYLALKEKLQMVDLEEAYQAKNFFENKVKNILNGKGFIVGETALRNSNTTMIILPGHSSSFLLTAFDLAQIDVSSGPACSSGIAGPNKVLKAMGFTDEEASSSIRLSFDPAMRMERIDEIVLRVSEVLKRLT